MSEMSTYLKGAFELAMIGGGGRRKEITSLRWSNIFPSDNGNLAGGIIRYENFKVNSLTNAIFDEEKEDNNPNIPITSQLAKLLVRLGYKKSERVFQYVIAPEIERRQTVMDDISKGFSFYYAQIKNPRQGISFRNLRKTYMTYLNLLVGDSGEKITKQNDKTRRKYYHDEDFALKTKVRKGLKF